MDGTRNAGRCIEQVGGLCAAFGIESLRPQLEAAADALREGGVVDIAVLGQFKAGKSSFLNSLIGREVVPVGVLPATAVVTRIGFGPSEAAFVRGLSGEVEEVSPDRLAEYVTEQGNPGNEKRIAWVDVELPSLERYRGVRFVDTPGLGSIFSHNTRTSLEWLPRVGGALVAVAITQPLSEQDLALLQELFFHTPEVAILLTKADLVTESQADQVLEFTRRQVARHAGKELSILPFSILPGHEGKMRGVLEHLERRIVGSREARFDEIMGHKARSLVSGCREYLRLAERAAESAEQARAELALLLRREREEIGPVGQEVALFVRELSVRVRSVAGERFHAYHGELSARLQRELREQAAGWRGNLAETTRAFEEWLGRSLEEELSRVSLHGESHLSGFLLKARASLSRTVRAFQDRLAREIERALKISFRGAVFQAGIEQPSRPDIRLGRIFDTHFELLWFLVPMSIFRPVVFRHFHRRISWEVEKNLSRLAGQWAASVNGAVDRLARQALDFMKSERSTIEGIVSGVDGRLGEIRTALEKLSGLERDLGRS